MQKPRFKKHQSTCQKLVLPLSLIGCLNMLSHLMSSMTEEWCLATANDYNLSQYMLIVSLDKCFNILEDNGHYLRSKHGFLKKSLVLDISNLCKHKMRSLMLKKSFAAVKSSQSIHDRTRLEYRYEVQYKETEFHIKRLANTSLCLCKLTAATSNFTIHAIFIARE